MKLGIVGLPNVGKSTLFNSLTRAGAASANFPFCTIDPNIGIVAVPDERLTLLSEFSHSKKTTPAVIEFVDIAGLVRGASKGEGLGNQFLANIRECDAIVHVVRCFENENIIHVEGSIDPARDIETIELELIFADLEVLERRISKTAKTAKSGASKDAKREYDLLLELKAHLENGQKAISFIPDDEENVKFKASLDLLTDKPVIYAANVEDSDLADDGASNEYVAKVREIAANEGAEVFVISAQIEEEIAELDDDEKQEFLADLGIEKSGLEKLIAASYHLLGLMSYLLPRYLVMMNGADDFFNGSFAQWSENNVLPCDPFTGEEYNSWQEVKGYVDNYGGNQRNRTALARLAGIPSQAVCARWMPNLEGACHCNHPFNLFGIEIYSGNSSELRSDNYDIEIFSPNDESGGSVKDQYILDGVTVQDGWWHEFYYYSPEPHQKYTLWSAGPNGRTFPPWVPRDDSKMNQCVAVWTVDDIIHMSN